MKSIRRNLIKRIHVNQAEIRKNRKDGGDRPTLTIQTSSGPIRSRRVVIKGRSELVQSQKPLSCGARVWIETRAEVEYSE